MSMARENRIAISKDFTLEASKLSFTFKLSRVKLASKSKVFTPRAE